MLRYTNLSLCVQLESSRRLRLRHYLLRRRVARSTQGRKPDVSLTFTNLELFVSCAFTSRRPPYTAGQCSRDYRARRSEKRANILLMLQGLALNTRTIRMVVLSDVGYVAFLSSSGSSAFRHPHMKFRCLTCRTAITFLAQWHPLVVPRRNDLRPGIINHEGPSGPGLF